jgi:uncharacterized integral membrane protein
MGILTIRKRRAAHRRRGLHGLGFWWTFAASLVLGAAIIVAIVQNSSHVKLHYLAWHVNVSLIVVILATALVGVLLDEAGGLIWRRRRRSSLARRTELNEFRAQQEPPGETASVAEPATTSAEK